VTDIPKKTETSGADGPDQIAPAMTVEDAIRIYADFGDTLEPFFVDIYERLIADRPSVELPNADYLHALQLTALMLRNAQDDFCMLSGGSADCFTKTLKAEFLKMLKRFANGGRNSVARVVVVNPTDDLPELTELQKEFPANLKIFRAQSPHEERIGHYIVADNMVREELPHKRLTKQSRADEIKAKVFFNNKSRADLFRSNFNSLARMWNS